MLNTHFNKAANELANHLKSKLAPTLMMKNLSLKQALKCDQRLFYVFDLDYHNGPSSQMVIIGNYYSLDPNGQGMILENLGSFNPQVAATVIKTFVQNHPLSSEHTIFDSQYSFDNVEQEIETIDSQLNESDAESLAELMSIRSIHGSILSTSGELNVNNVLSAFMQLWNIDFNSIEGFALSQDANSIKVHYHNFDVYLSCSPRIINDELLQTSAMFNQSWPEAFSKSKNSTHMFNITIDSNCDMLDKAREFVKWAAAILASHESSVSVLYNYYIYEPQAYLNQALVMKDNAKAVPVMNLIWMLLTPKDDKVVVNTSGLSELGRLELVSDEVSLEEASVITQVFYNVAQFLLSNNAHLLPGNEVKLNDDLVFDTQIIISPEDGSKTCRLSAKK